jgi:hypothetical protein
MLRRRPLLRPKRQRWRQRLWRKQRLQPGRSRSKYRAKHECDLCRRSRSIYRMSWHRPSSLRRTLSRSRIPRQASRPGPCAVVCIRSPLVLFPHTRIRHAHAPLCNWRRRACFKDRTASPPLGPPVRAHSTLHALAAFAEPGLLDLANRNVNNEDKRTARLPPLNNPDTAILNGHQQGSEPRHSRLQRAAHALPARNYLYVQRSSRRNPSQRRGYLAELLDFDRARLWHGEFA